MNDESARLNRVLDDLAAERDPADRAALSPGEVDLAEMAVFLKAARRERSLPDEDFVTRLGARLAAACASDAAPPPRRPARAGGLSRRRLLDRAGTAAAGLAVGVGVSGVAAYDQGTRDGYRQGVSAPYDTPLAPADRGHWFNTRHTTAGVTSGRAVRFTAGAITGFLVNPGGGQPIYALSAACTHMGCLISWLDQARTFLCPCHGAQYTAEGHVLSGIVRSPLPRLRVRVGTGGHLYVWGVPTHPSRMTLLPYTDASR